MYSLRSKGRYLRGERCNVPGDGSKAALVRGWRRSIFERVTGSRWYSSVPGQVKMRGDVSRWRGEAEEGWTPLSSSPRLHSDCFNCVRRGQLHPSPKPVQVSLGMIQPISRKHAVKSGAGRGSVRVSMIPILSTLSQSACRLAPKLIWPMAMLSECRLRVMCY